MKKNSKLSAFFNDIVAAADKNSPAILTGMAVAGLVTTGIMLWKASPKAQKVINNYKETMSDLEECDELSPEVKKQETVEFVKEIAPIVAPPIIMGMLTTTCIIASNRISTKRIAALSAAYSLAEKGYSEYAEKAKEMLGKNKESKISEGVVEDHMSRNPYTGSNVIETGTGNTLFYDDSSDRYFHASIDAVHEAFKKISDRQELEDWIELNDLYYEIGLPTTTNGSILGFSRSRGKVSIGKVCKIADDGNPCRVLSLDVVPDPSYYTETC